MSFRKKTQKNFRGGNTYAVVNAIMEALKDNSKPVLDVVRQYCNTTPGNMCASLLQDRSFVSIGRAGMAMAGISLFRYIWIALYGSNDEQTKLKNKIREYRRSHEDTSDYRSRYRHSNDKDDSSDESDSGSISRSISRSIRRIRNGRRNESRNGSIRVIVKK